jgi:hypothetical protein
MSYAANAMMPAQRQFSPLMLSDQLLTLAEHADHAGLRRVGQRLLGLALSVLDQPDPDNVVLQRAPRRSRATRSRQPSAYSTSGV